MTTGILLAMVPHGRRPHDMHFDIVPIVLMVLALALSSSGEARELCGEEGIWIQILGSGGPELNDERAPASYLVWIEGKSRLLVDTGPGSTVAFDLAGGRIKDLEAIVYTQLRAEHASDFPAFVEGSRFGERRRALPVFGPAGNEMMPSMKQFVDAMIGPHGAFRHLQDFLTYNSSGGFRISARDVPSTGRRVWARFATQNLRLASIPVHHGDIPAIAWRVNIGEQSITFSGDFSNQKNTLVELANETDALVVHHSVPESARGDARERHARPSQIGRVARDADVRMLLVSHRMHQTLGRESLSIAAIETYYRGPILFANDLDCWGL